MKDEILYWIQTIEKEEGKPSEDIIAFNFGLIESENTFITYLIGTKEYSSDDDDWACEEGFTPKNRYFELPEELHRGDWENAENFMKSVLTELLEEGKLKDTFLEKAVAITTGFDDGELKRIK